MAKGRRPRKGASATVACSSGRTSDGCARSGDRALAKRCVCTRLQHRRAPGSRSWLYMSTPLMTPESGPFAAGFPLARGGSQGNTGPERQPACATDRSAACPDRMVQAPGLRPEERALRAAARRAADAPGRADAGGAGNAPGRAGRARAQATQGPQRLHRRRHQRAVLRRGQGTGGRHRRAQPRSAGPGAASSTRSSARRSATVWRSARAPTWC